MVILNLSSLSTEKNLSSYSKQVLKYSIPEYPQLQLINHEYYFLKLEYILQLKNNFSKEDIVVVLLHDSGSRYIGKIFNDEWMKKMKFIS